MDQVSPDVMRSILNSYLDDDDLATMCMLNHRFNERICNSNFWRNKIMERFGLSREEIERYRGGNTYWSYYNFLATQSSRDPDSLLIYSTVNRRLDLLNMAINAGANLDKWDGNNLRYAVQKNYVEIVERLLQAGADPNIDGGDPLDTAIYYGYSEIVKLLVNAGATTHNRHIEEARQKGYDEIVEILSSKINR